MYNKDTVFDELCKRNYVTTSVLKQLGLNNHDITNLVNENFLFRVCKGYYKTNIERKDYNYKMSYIRLAKQYFYEKNYTKAKRILNKYVHLDISSKAHYLLYLINLYEENYIEALKELKISISLIKDINNDLYTSELLMLNKIIDLQSKEKKLLKE